MSSNLAFLQGLSIPSTHSCVYPSISPPVCLPSPVHPSFSQLTYPSVHLPVSPPIYLLLSIHHFFFPPMSLPPPVYHLVPVYPSIHPSTHLSVPHPFLCLPHVHPASIYLVVAACQTLSQAWRSTSKHEGAQIPSKSQALFPYPPLFGLRGHPAMPGHPAWGFLKRMADNKCLVFFHSAQMDVHACGRSGFLSLKHE